MREFMTMWNGLSNIQRVIMALFLAVVVGGGGWLIIGPSIMPADTPQEPQGVQEAAEEEPGRDVAMTEEQSRAIAEYGDAEQELIARLKNGLWSTLDEASTVTFTDRTYTVAGEPTRTYAITALTETAPNPYADGIAQIDDIAAILTDEGTSILVMHRTPGGKGDEDSLEMTSEPNSIYLRYGISQAIEIEGDLDKLADAVGDDTVAGFVKELRSQASEYFPTASVATWSNKAELDWEEGKVKTEFTLNNSGATKVELESEIVKAKKDTGDRQEG